MREELSPQPASVLKMRGGALRAHWDERDALTPTAQLSSSPLTAHQGPRGAPRLGIVHALPRLLKTLISQRSHKHFVSPRLP